jgi:hypothetical protein
MSTKGQSPREEYTPHDQEDSPASPYAEFAEEDRKLTEDGLREYGEELSEEDKR